MTRVFVLPLLIAAVVVTVALYVRDTRLVATILWGAGTAIVWLLVFIKAVRQWRAFRDRRARGDVLSDGALFLVAAAAAIAIGFALFSQDLGPDDRLRQLARMFSALALGGFLAAGLVKLQESPPEPDDKDVEAHRR